MSKSAGTELHKDVEAAAATRITLKNLVVCSFDLNPRENSDLLFSIITTREHTITHITKPQKLNRIKKLCEDISYSHLT